MSEDGGPASCVLLTSTASPFEVSPPKVKISSLTFCYNMVLSITGTCLLGVGAQMKTGGWIITPALLFAGAVLTYEMVWLISATTDKLEKEGQLEVISYQDFAEAALGRAGWWASSISSTLSLGGMIIGGLIIESQNLQIALPMRASFPLGGSDADEQGRRWWAVCISVTTFFYCVVDIGSLLQRSGLVGVVLTVLCVLLLFAGTFGQFGSAGDFNPACADGGSMSYHSFGPNEQGVEGFEAFLSFFSVTSYMVYAFAIVVTVPTVRSTMQRKEAVPHMSAISFFIVGLLFLAILLAYYWVFGNVGPQNIIDGMRGDREAHPGWWATVDPWSVGRPTGVAKSLGWGVTLHLLCSDAIYVPCTVVAVEALLPRHWLRGHHVWLGLRISLTLLRLLVATVVADFVKMSNLTSAAFLTMNNLLLPVLAFYCAGPTEKVGRTRRAVHFLVVVFAVFSMVFGTISAVLGIAREASSSPSGTFPRAGISQKCHEAYCALATTDPGCGGTATSGAVAWRTRAVGHLRP